MTVAKVDDFGRVESAAPESGVWGVRGELERWLKRVNRRDWEYGERVELGAEERKKVVRV